jgi:hypothetical protein
MTESICLRKEANQIMISRNSSNDELIDGVITFLYSQGVIDRN